MMMMMMIASFYAPPASNLPSTCTLSIALRQHACHQNRHFATSSNLRRHSGYRKAARLPERLRLFLRFQLNCSIFKTPVGAQEATRHDVDRIAETFRRADVAARAGRFHMRHQGAGGAEGAQAGHTAVVDTGMSLDVLGHLERVIH